MEAGGTRSLPHDRTVVAGGRVPRGTAVGIELDAGSCILFFETDPEPAPGRDQHTARGGQGNGSGRRPEDATAQMTTDDPRTSPDPMTR